MGFVIVIRFVAQDIFAFFSSFDFFALMWGGLCFSFWADIFFFLFSIFFVGKERVDPSKPFNSSGPSTKKVNPGFDPTFPINTHTHTKTSPLSQFPFLLTQRRQFRRNLPATSNPPNPQRHNPHTNPNNHLPPPPKNLLYNHTPTRNRTRSPMQNRFVELYPAVWKSFELE